MLLFTAAAISAQDRTTRNAGDDAAELQVEPERVFVEVAPVEAVIGGMPDLQPLEFEDPEQTVSVPREVTPESLAPPEIPRETVTAVPLATSADQVYFNATLGGGSVNSVLGSINVYRLGQGPQFRVGYDHRGADGFNFNDPGSGFFRQENELETWVRLGAGGRSSLELQGTYADRRLGLQRQPTFYSADTRSLTGWVDARHEWDARSAVGVRLDVEDRRRVLARIDATDVPQTTYRLLRPEVRGRLEWPRLRLEARGDYDGRFSVGDAVDVGSSIGLMLAVEGVPFEGLTLRAQGATRYRFDDGAYFPVEGGASYRGSERWGLDLSGGYRVTESRPASLWDGYAVTVPQFTDGTLPAVETLFAAGRLDVAVVPALVQLFTGLEWEHTQNGLIVEGYDARSTVAAYPVVVGDRERLDAEVGTALTLGERTTASLGWTAHLRDRRVGEAPQEIQAAVEVEWDSVSGGVETRVPITDEGEVPIIDTEVRYQLARDVEIRVFGRDLLAPLDDAGRTSRGLAPTEDDPFVTPGLEIGFAVRVSF